VVEFKLTGLVSPVQLTWLSQDPLLAPPSQVYDAAMAAGVTARALTISANTKR